jgi:glucose-1-phosphate thymidylyltransferase
MKALIMARGLGTRLRQPEAGAQLDPSQRIIAEQGLKSLIPVGRPLLDYALARLADAGFQDIGVVIGPEHTLVRQHVASLALSRVRVRFVEQAEPKGTADAVLAGERFAAGQPFMVVNADNLYPIDVLSQVRQFTGQGLPAFAAHALVTQGNIRPERAGRFPLVRWDARKRLTELVERDGTPGPGNGADEYISMNCWVFTAAIFPACRAVGPSPRGELEITEAVRVAMARGEIFEVFPVSRPVLDVTSRADVAGVAERLKDEAVNL